MSRKGRKRKPGRREPNGRIVSQSKLLQIAGVRQTVMDYRQNHYGLSKEDATQPNAETVFGRLALAGKLALRNGGLNDARYLAGVFYLETRNAAHRAFLSQQMRSGGDMERQGGHDSDDGTEPEYVEQCQRARKRDDELLAMIADKAKGEALSTLFMVICEDMEPLDMDGLWRGLDAIRGYLLLYHFVP